MKILIGTYEIAGWVQQYKQGFESLGHTVTTAVFEKVSWFDYEYDYLLQGTYEQGRDNRQLQPSQYFQRFVRKIKNAAADRNYQRYVFNLIDQHDLIIIFWRPFTPSYAEYAYAQKKGKKLVCLFVGSDARYFQTFSQEFDISHFNFPDDWKKTDPDFHLRFVRHAEKFADSIYSLPDQAGLQLRPYFHLQVPIAETGITFRNNNRLVPKVLHAPGIPYKKGTDIIERVLEQLKQEGVEYEMVSVRNVPHAELMNLLADIDVVVDELVYHGPGALSFEAMLSGCAVATRYLENSPECFRPPVMAIDATNIYERLRRLLTDQGERQRMIEAGREYVRANNSAQKVAGNILDNLVRPASFDYYPHFFCNEYHPVNAAEVEQLNKWTAFVSDCDWYKKYVPQGEREGLKF